MARILLIATHCSEDPTRAGLAFLFAKGAVEEGHQPEVILAGDAAVLARQTVAENIIPVGLPPLKDLMAFALKHKVPVYT
jgi:predicted peroxiredoxin